MTLDFNKAFDQEWAGQEPPSDSPPPEPKGADPYPFVKLEDLEPDLRNRFIVRNLIPRQALGVAYAPPGAGKTAISIDLALHIAAGLEYRGRRTEKQPVVYVILEGQAGINNRALAAAQKIGIEGQDYPFAIVKAAGSFRSKETAQRVAATATALMKEYGGDNPVITVDTFQAALGAGGNDCNPEDVSALIENVKHYLLEISCTVVLVHHTGKDASRGARGWSGLLAALDFELEIDRSDDLRTLRVSKMRDGSDKQPGFCFRLEERFLGRDQYDEPVTTVVVQHLADEDKAKPGKKLSPKARGAIEQLWKMIEDKSSSFAPSDIAPLRCVTFGAWRKACVEPGVVCHANTEKDRAKKFRAAAKELEEAGMIIRDNTDEEGEGGRVRPTPKECEGHA